MQTVPQPSTEDLLKVAGVVIGVVGGLSRWLSTRYRSALKDDIEILKRYAELRHVGDPNDDVHYRALRTQIERTMHNAYNRPGVDWQSFAWALVSIAGAFGTLLADRLTSWVGVTFVLIGMVGGTAIAVHSLTRRWRHRR